MRKFTLVLSMMAMGSIVFGQPLIEVQHRLSSMDDVSAKTDFQPTKRDIIDAGDILFVENFNASAWSAASADGIAIPANMPAGWTVVDNTNNNYFWRWSTDGPRGRYTAGTTTCAVPNQNHKLRSTSDNTAGGEQGFMILESDWYNTTPACAATFNAMDTYIQYGPIDASNNPGVNIIFEQWHRFCCTDNSLNLSISTNGTDWTNFPVHKASVNATPASNPSRVEVALSSVAANQSTVYFRFHQTLSSHYYWQIDDITIYEPPTYDTRIDGFWVDYNEGRMTSYQGQTNSPHYNKLYSNIPFFSAYHALQPFISARALSQNFGSAPATNLTLTANIVKGAEVLYTATSNPPVANHLVGHKDSLEVAIDFPFPPAMDKIGSYYVQGVVNIAEEDELPNNNISPKYDFHITENLFGYANPEFAATERISNQAFTSGVDGDGMGFIVMLNPSAGTPYLAKGINVFINNDGYNWDMWESNNIPLLQADLYEGTLVDGNWEFDFTTPKISTASTGIDSTYVNSWVYMPFISDGGNHIVNPTAAGQQYAVVIRYFTNDMVFWTGGDKVTQPSWYAYILCLGNEQGWTSQMKVMSMELVLDTNENTPLGTAKIIVNNVNPEIPDVTHPAVGAVVKFHTQNTTGEELGEAVVTSYTIDNNGFIEVPNLRAGTYSFSVEYAGADTVKTRRNGIAVLGSGTYEKTITFDLVGINNRPSISGVKLYPNPTNNAVTIESPAVISRIVVSNIIGQVVDVINNPAQNQTLSVANYATGVYMVTLFDNSGNSTTQRLIKQ